MKFRLSVYNSFLNSLREVNFYFYLVFSYLKRNVLVYKEWTRVLLPKFTGDYEEGEPEVKSKGFPPLSSTSPSTTRGV